MLFSSARMGFVGIAISGSAAARCGKAMPFRKVTCYFRREAPPSAGGVASPYQCDVRR